MDTAFDDRSPFDQMWTFAAYRDDHAAAQAQRALDLLQPATGDSVVDFGAGAGYGARHLLDAGLRVLAIDLEPHAMLPDIASRVPRLVGNLWDLPVDLAADWGFCCDVLPYIATDRMHDALKTIRRSTRRATFFSLSLRPDGPSALAHEAALQTVRSLEWWLATLAAHWTTVRVVGQHGDDRVDILADGGKAPDASELRDLLRDEVRAAIADSLYGLPAVDRPLNYRRLAHVTAALDSSRYLNDRMLGAVDLETDAHVREHALTACHVDGTMLELRDQASLEEMAAPAAPAVHGFQPEPARFVYVDGTLATSARVVLDALEPRLVPGTVVVFGRYLNFPGWQAQTHRALAEFIARTGRGYDYLGFASSQLAVSLIMR